MGTLIWFLWLLGVLFTDGLLDPRNEQGFRQSAWRAIAWPYELGQYVEKRERIHREVEGGK